MNLPKIVIKKLQNQCGLVEQELRQALKDEGAL